MSRYSVTKTYGHNLGLSAVFRQWRADSHCRFLHGYALEVKLTFSCGAHERDKNGWVIDFGSLKPIKSWLEQTFDHKVLVAKDDPALTLFKVMHDDVKNGKLIDLVVVDAVGCEAFAKMIADYVNEWLDNGGNPWTAARLDSVEVREHGANSALYICETD